jgi:small GTP-binding protein
MMDTYEKIVRYKMVLFGNANVGKTSLVERFINDQFEQNYISTLGYNVYEKEIIYENNSISLMIYDIGGQEKFRDLRRKYAEGADLAFIVFDLTNPESFAAVKAWKTDLFEFAGEIPFIIIGNKNDLAPKVTTKDGMQISNSLGALDYLETSAKTGKGVEKAFNQLAVKSVEKAFGEKKTE